MKPSELSPSVQLHCRISSHANAILQRQKQIFPGSSDAQIVELGVALLEMSDAGPKLNRATTLLFNELIRAIGNINVRQLHQYMDQFKSKRGRRKANAVTA